jgi:predicted transcriptional regulator
MSGHQPFSNLTANFSPQRKAQIAAKTEQLKSEMALNELRSAFSLTQDRLASKLNVKQPAISRLEKHSDMYISHLREVIEAMGGELEITARFNGQEVKITNFNFAQADSEVSDR